MNIVKKKILIVFIVIAAAVILCNLGIMAIKNVREERFTVRVTDKMRVSYGHVWNTHKYLIFTIDDETGTVRVFENTDALPYGKLNSSDYYARISVGHTYTFRVVGFRIPFFNLYKNIIGIKLIE